MTQAPEETPEKDGVRGSQGASKYPHQMGKGSEGLRE